MKAASPADASITEIPVPDLPEGTWDDHHWSSRKKIKKRMMMTMMGGGEPPARGSDGGLKRRAGKRVKGGPRILRSAGKASACVFFYLLKHGRRVEVEAGAGAGGGGGIASFVFAKVQKARAVEHLRCASSVIIRFTRLS